MTFNLNDYLQTTYTDPECQRIIFGVLKRLHISYYCPDRADFEQDARLIMAKAMQRFDSTHSNLPSQHNHARYLYLYQHLYWRLIDRLRVQKRRTAQIQMSLDKDFANTAAQIQQEKILQDFAAEHEFTKLEINNFLQTLISQLTTQQRRYLQLLYLGYKPSEIADRLGISRQAVANLRRRIIKIGRHLVRSTFH